MVFDSKNLRGLSMKVFLSFINLDNFQIANFLQNKLTTSIFPFTQTLLGVASAAIEKCFTAILRSVFSHSP